MKIIAVNGSPRKTWNTATLLNKALEGATSQGAETELIHLYDLNFKGCTSCFACKTIGGKSYGKCAMNDDLTPVLEKIGKADAIILGTPIYFGAASGEMRSFMERMIFPYLTYDRDTRTLFPRKIRIGLIYTMNAPDEFIKMIQWDEQIGFNGRVLKMVFGYSESLLSTDTYQFDDYSKYATSMFDPEKKAKRRQEVFPEDCAKAYNMGVRFAIEKINDEEAHSQQD